MSNLKINVSNEEILKAKFNKTIAKIEGYVTEARGDIHIRTTYSAEGVHNRMDNIKTAFYEDLKNLSSDLTVNEEPQPILTLHQKVYHKEIYDGKEQMIITGMKVDTKGKVMVELEGDYSGGTHNVCQREWYCSDGLLYGKN